MTADEMKQKMQELPLIQSDFYKLWNGELGKGDVALRDYKAEAMAWRFYLAGRRHAQDSRQN